MSMIAAIREGLDGVARLVAGRKTSGEVRDARAILEARIATEYERLAALQERKRDALKRQIRGEVGGDSYADLEAEIEIAQKSISLLEASREEIDSIEAELAAEEAEAALEERMQIAADARKDALAAYSDLAKILPKVTALVEKIRASNMTVEAANAEARAVGRGDLVELTAYNLLNAKHFERVDADRADRAASARGHTPGVQMIAPMMDPAGPDLRIPGFVPAHESFLSALAAVRL